MPDLLIELREKYPDDELDRSDRGTLYVGDKGIIHTAAYGNRMHLVPMARMNEVAQPPKTLSSPKNVIRNHQPTPNLSARVERMRR